MNRRLALLTTGLLLAASAQAARDEVLLGRDEGHPLCPAASRPEPRCFVALVSRFDEVFPARVVKKGPVTLPLQRAAAEPAIRYSHAQGGEIIPATWVREATTPPGKQFEPGQATGFLGYGYQTWILPGKQPEFMLRGLRNQAIFVAPRQRIVMVHTAAEGVGGGIGEVLSLWSGVVRSLTAF